MIGRFPECLPYTLAQECPFPKDWGNAKNFSNDAHDPGGATMCGITQREYDMWRKHHGLAVQEVRSISQAEGSAIYLMSYWLPDCPRVPPGLDLQLFDSSVNEGCAESIKLLQHCIGTAVDGLWGPKTAAAVAAITDVPTIIKAFTERREAVYKEMAGYPYFGKDWERRSSEVGAAALTMTSNP